MAVDPASPPAVKRARATARPAAAAAGGSPRAVGAAARHLIATIHEHYPQADLEPVERAYRFAAEAHEGQKRATGEPYVTHPLAVAQILVELGLDPVAVTAACSTTSPRTPTTTSATSRSASGPTCRASSTA